MAVKRSRWVVTLAAVAGFAITAAACHWQYDKGRRKDALLQRMELAARQTAIDLGSHTVPEDNLYRPVTARGVFLQHTTVLQDNQARGARPGYVVFSALRLDDGRHVLVKRGWVEGDLDRARLPSVSTPDGTVIVGGLALPPSGRFLEFRATPLTAAVWQNVTVDRYGQRFGLDFQPLVLEQHSDTADGLLRDWPKPASGSAKHYGYAFQWGAMAILILVLHAIFLYRQLKKTRPA
jgi:surfeit locus 1 family protein